MPMVRAAPHDRLGAWPRLTAACAHAARAVRQNFGVTPLHRAAKLGNLEVAKVLLNHGADAAALDDEQETPADYAAEKEHKALSAMLRKWEEDAQQEAAAAAARAQAAP